MNQLSVMCVSGLTMLWLLSGCAGAPGESADPSDSGDPLPAESSDPDAAPPPLPELSELSEEVDDLIATMKTHNLAMQNIVDSNPDDPDALIETIRAYPVEHSAEISDLYQKTEKHWKAFTPDEELAFRIKITNDSGNLQLQNSTFAFRQNHPEKGKELDALIRDMSAPPEGALER